MVAVKKSLKLGEAKKKTTKEKRSKLVSVHRIQKKLRKRGRRGNKNGTNKGTKRSGNLQIKNDELIKSTQVLEAVQALLLLVEKTADADSQLFSDEPQPILMQVTAARVPKIPPRKSCFKLPHPVITETTNVCIFVHNLTKKYRKNLDRTIEHYKELFQKEGITQISQIIPLKQLKTEYKQYEEKRRLCQQFDVFLSDARIYERVTVHFGKFLKYSLKSPIPVHVHIGNLKQEIDKALSKTSMHFHGKGDSFIVQVGHTKQPVRDVVQNIGFVTMGLSKVFPGGWDNVSAVYIKTPNSLSVPVYVSMKSPNEIPVPLEKPKRPKNMLPAEGELSTRIGYTARVYPAGRVDLKKVEQDSDIEWSGEEDWETEWKNFENMVFLDQATRKLQSELEEGEKPAKKLEKKTRKEDSDVEVKDEEEIEADIADAEESYLQQWKRRRDEAYDEKNKNIKKEEVSEGPNRKKEVRQGPKSKKVKYVVGEMSLGRLGNEPVKKTSKSGSRGMVHTAFQELKSKINKKKAAKNQKTVTVKKSVVCSNKNSGKQKTSSKGKRKGKPSK